MSTFISQNLTEIEAVTAGICHIVFRMFFCLQIAWFFRSDQTLSKVYKDPSQSNNVHLSQILFKLKSICHLKV